MATRDHPCPAPVHHAQSAETAPDALSSLPFDELLRIAQIFAPNQVLTQEQRSREQNLPAPQQPLTPEVRHLANEPYMARVHELHEQEEHILRTRAVRDPAPQCPQLASPPAIPPPTPVIPASVWKYSAITLSTGGGIALTGYGIGAAAPALALLDDVLKAASQFVMSATALVIVVCLALSARPAQKAGGSGTVINIGKAIFKKGRLHR
ncbi:hypothetical protein [Streptomyces qinglanensis]|uniref:hypothetical protein n=1 Tax=Streptomyces qinglanensis TaxID=943816 RepID=UPI003D749C35